MKIKIKPKSYYKRCYGDHYSIWYTGNKYAYIIARKYTNEPLVKLAKKELWNTIDSWQIYLTDNKYKTKELSKEDVFLELL